MDIHSGVMEKVDKVHFTAHHPPYAESALVFDEHYVTDFDDLGTELATTEENQHAQFLEICHEFLIKH
ncbi:unnamed protein product [Schistocephalus solidus]|uniref:Metal-dependent hydrolase n=1 Tax=Schistocephalus solidus TaxID=70667 RepID=A0A183SRA6_SCHSO|nr:unnamed protein product [Schistocephalus solidus]